MEHERELTDLEVAGLWWERFGEPLPLLGCADIALSILKEAGALRAPEPRSFAED